MDDTTSNDTTAKDAEPNDPDGNETDENAIEPQRKGRSFGPEPELPEKLARQWGYTDDSYKVMSFHRRTRTGWVLMKEPVDDFGRKFMGLPPLPRHVFEVRSEERRQEELEMLIKKHGVKTHGTCEKCRENGKKVRTYGARTSRVALTLCCSAMAPAPNVPSATCGTTTADTTSETLRAHSTTSDAN